MKSQTEIDEKIKPEPVAPADEQEQQTKAKSFGELVENAGPGLFIIGFWAIILIWNLVPADAKGGNIYRLLATGGLITLTFLIIVFSFKDKVSIFNSLSKLIVITSITIGTAFFPVFFFKNDQVIFFKMLTVVFFSFLPAFLYLDFIKTKGRTLWEEYVINLYRLRIEEDFANLPKPPIHSPYFKPWEDAMVKSTGQPKEKTIYEQKFEGYFGPIPTNKKYNFFVFQGENLWSVAILTLMIAVGLVFVTQLEPLYNNRIFPQSISTLRNDPILPVETLRFAFLGAYFYILQMLVRRYFQNDLKTSAYISSAMRIIIVILLVWVIDLVWHNQIPQAERSLMAFVIGVFPHVGWQAILAVVKWPIKKTLLPSLDQKFPLNKLEGLNIWYEFRLLEEGIEDMQNLATANIVDIMLNTRIPIERLVDWINQSFLFLHLNNTGADQSDLNELRKYGIRTATDLEDTVENTQDERLERLLNKPGDEKPNVLLCVYIALKKAPNMRHVRNWRHGFYTGQETYFFHSPLENAQQKNTGQEKDISPVSKLYE